MGRVGFLMTGYKKIEYPSILSQEQINNVIQSKCYCFNCGKVLQKHRVTHVNVFQEIPVHVFCKKKCREIASYRRKF